MKTKKATTEKNIYVREVTDVVEMSTGEVTINKRSEVASFEKEPAYVKLYLNDIGRLKGLNNSEQKLINELVFNMGYNNVVPAYKPVKELIAERLGIKFNTVNEALKSLHKKGILIRKARGFYIMDPNLFGRGSWKDVKSIRMVIDYNSDGTKSINAEVSKQLNLF